MSDPRVETKIADVTLVIDDGGPSLILGAPDRPPSVMVACRRCAATMRLREAGSEWMVCGCPGREVRRSTFADMMPDAVRAMFYAP